jgi:hypothetical protein
METTLNQLDAPLDIKLSDYPDPGLYLILKDSTRLTLTKDNINKVTKEYWADPAKIPDKVKKAVDFQRCPFCPLKNKNDFCDSLRPVLPLLDDVDKFISYDKVTAIFKSEEKGLLHVSSTTMQNALRYVSIISLMSHCQIGHKYWKYYTGIVPIQRTNEIANRLYLNFYWYHKGNKEAIDEVITKFYKDITATTRNQVRRLKLICQNDVFLNAFVNTQLISDVLHEDRDCGLKNQFDKAEKELYSV